jgi:hypothetical protein
MFCDIINLSVGIMQMIIDVLFGFWSLLGMTVPDIRGSFGSLFGCNV